MDGISRSGKQCFWKTVPQDADREGAETTGRADLMQTPELAARTRR